MIQRWNKKKTQLPLIAIVFFLFVLFYNERRFQEIHRKENRKPNDITTRNDVKKTFSSLNRSGSKASAGTLDRSSTCNSTVKYNGRSNLNTPLLQSDEQENTKDSCNMFSGIWVFDNIYVPLYNESDCPYMSDQLACHKNGRPDLMYQNWRWQPHGCHLKR
ncbi:putative PMR5 domain, trichome birefringence-like family [Helianthus anomalus]